MTNPTIVSRHFLRRRARKKERELTAAALYDFHYGPKVGARPTRYRVQRARRGPWRWYVVAS